MSEPEQKSADLLGEDDPFADAALVDDLGTDDAGLGDPGSSDPGLSDPGLGDPGLGDPGLGEMDAGAPLTPQQPVQPRTQKPRSNVYTMMLILSFAAIVTSCVVLYLHLKQYGDYPWWEVPADVRTDVGA